MYYGYVNNNPFLSVKCMDVSVPAHLCEFVNRSSDHLEIATSTLGGFVISVTCYACSTLFEAELKFPDSEEFCNYNAVCYLPKSYHPYELRNCGQFQMSFNRNGLDIVFLNNFNKFKKMTEAKSFKDNGKKSLKKYKSDRPTEDFAPIAYL